MKILHIHPSMSGGGIEAMICGLVNEMSKENDVYLLTIYSINDKDVFEPKLSPLVHRFSLNKEKEGFSLVEIFKIFNFIRKRNFDVVHIHGFFYYYAFSVYLLHSKVKFIYTIHSDAKKENSVWDRRLFFLKKNAFRCGYIHPITISKESKRSFTNLYGVDSTLIYNGIPCPEKETITSSVSKYKKTDETIIFFHPGRISQAKNQLVLVKVFSRLISEGKDVVLLIAGSKQDLNIFRTIQPFFSDRIIYLGEVSNVRDLLAESDAFCLPSIWEGMPITLFEALSAECIPICSPVGGIPEIIDSGNNGFLSKDSTESSYYMAVCEYLQSTKEQISKMKVQCKKTFENFTISKVAKKYIDVYKYK